MLRPAPLSAACSAEADPANCGGGLRSEAFVAEAPTSREVGKLVALSCWRWLTCVCAARSCMGCMVYAACVAKSCLTNTRARAWLDLIRWPWRAGRHCHDMWRDVGYPSLRSAALFVERKSDSGKLQTTRMGVLCKMVPDCSERLIWAAGGMQKARRAHAECLRLGAGPGQIRDC